MKLSRLNMKKGSSVEAKGARSRTVVPVKPKTRLGLKQTSLNGRSIETIDNFNQVVDRANTGTTSASLDTIVNDYVASSASTLTAAQIAGGACVQARVPILLYDKEQLSFSNVPFSEISESDIETLNYLFGRAGLSNKMNSLIASLGAVTNATPEAVSFTALPDADQGSLVTLHDVERPVSGSDTVSVPVVRDGAYDRGVNPCIIPIIRVRISMQLLNGALNNLKLSFSGVYDRQTSVLQQRAKIQGGGNGGTIPAGTPLSELADYVEMEAVPNVTDQLKTGYFTINLNEMTSAMEFYVIPFDVYEGKTYIASLVAQPQHTTEGVIDQSGCGVTMDVAVRPTGCSIDMELITAMHPNYRQYKQRIYGQTVFMS